MTRDSESDNSGQGRLHVEPLLELLDALRAPETGCPWDREQRPDDILNCLAEEVEECRVALQEGELGAIADEAGDLLWNVLMLLHVLSEERGIGYDDLVGAVSAKMIYRHPHVFGEVQAHTIAGAKAAYEDAKRREGGEKA